jgi:hypothetical protein
MEPPENGKSLSAHATDKKLTEFDICMSVGQVAVSHSAMPAAQLVWI